MILHLAIDEVLDERKLGDEADLNDDPVAFLDTTYMRAHYVPASLYVTKYIADFFSFARLKLQQ